MESPSAMRRCIGTMNLRPVGRHRQDAGSTLRFMESPHDFCAVPWEHEPTPNPSQEGNRKDADKRLLPSRGGGGGGS